MQDSHHHYYHSESTALPTQLPLPAFDHNNATSTSTTACIIGEDQTRNPLFLMNPYHHNHDNQKQNQQDNDHQQQQQQHQADNIFIGVRQGLLQGHKFNNDGDKVMTHHVIRNCIFSNWNDAKLFLQNAPSAEYEIFDNIHLAVMYTFGSTGNGSGSRSDSRSGSSGSRNTDDTALVHYSGEGMIPTETIQTIQTDHKQALHAQQTQIMGNGDLMLTQGQDYCGDDIANCDSDDDIQKMTSQLIDSPLLTMNKKGFPTDGYEHNGMNFNHSTGDQSIDILTLPNAVTDTTRTSISTVLQESQELSQEKSYANTIHNSDDATIMQIGTETKLTSQTKRRYCSKKQQNKATQKFNSDWDHYFENLKQHIQKYGNKTPIPPTTPDNNDLIRWVKQQKREYRELQYRGKSKLSPSKIQKLNDMGFQFNSRQKYWTWEDRMKKFKDYVGSVGHGRVPINHPSLGNW
jgi:hypothetical protein